MLSFYYFHKSKIKHLKKFVLQYITHFDATRVSFLVLSNLTLQFSVNTVGSYACTCNNGYNGEGYSCKPNEVNECATGQHNCHVNVYCTDLRNNYGQYKCTCHNGYESNGNQCSPVYVDPCCQLRSNGDLSGWRLRWLFLRLNL